MLTSYRNNIQYFNNMEKTINTTTLEDETEKAFKVLRLNEELEGMATKKKAITKAFSEEMKRIKGEIKAIISNEPTDDQLVENIGDVHDI